MPLHKPQKPKPPDDPAEYERFVEAARKMGLDESPDALDRAFERVTGRRQVSVARSQPQQGAAPARTGRAFRRSKSSRTTG